MARHSISEERLPSTTEARARQWRAHWLHLALAHGLAPVAFAGGLLAMVLVQPTLQQTVGAVALLPVALVAALPGGWLAARRLYRETKQRDIIVASTFVGLACLVFAALLYCNHHHATNPRIEAVAVLAKAQVERTARVPEHWKL